MILATPSFQWCKNIFATCNIDVYSDVNVATQTINVGISNINCVYFVRDSTNTRLFSVYLWPSTTYIDIKENFVNSFFTNVAVTLSVLMLYISIFKLDQIGYIFRTTITTPKILQNELLIGAK